MRERETDETAVKETYRHNYKEQGDQNKKIEQEKIYTYHHTM